MEGVVTTKTDYVLTGHPLSLGFRRRLEQALGGEPTYLYVKTFREMAPGRILTTLRGLDAGRIVLAIEDAESRTVMPFLLGAASLARAQSRWRLDDDFCLHPWSRWGAVSEGLALARASASGLAATTMARTELKRLNRASRRAASSSGPRDVLYLNTNLWFGVKAGGSIGHVAGVVNAMQDSGLQVRLAAIGNRSMLRPGVEYLPLTPPEAFGLPYDLNYYRFHRMVTAQLRPLRDARPWSFIYQRMSVANYTGVVLSREWGVPLVLEYNGSEVWIARNWGRPRRFDALAEDAERASLRHAHVVVTVSEALGDELRARGVEPDRIVVYPNGIDPSVFNPARFDDASRTRLRRGLGLADDDVIATFVGTFGQWHGAEVFAEAIARVVARDADRLRASHLKFLFVGDGPRMPAVRRLLADVRHDEFVRFSGLVVQTDAPAYLAASDILVSPHVPNADGSPFFGSPTKLFEYMAMGKAIIASDLDQIGRVLRPASSDEGEGGDTRLAMLCTPGDPEDLVRALDAVVSDPALREALGANARRAALRRYTWRHHVDAILDRCRAQAIDVAAAGDLSC
jgi:glycosyltransferase involved in cell wall biosynthesis